MSLASFDQEDSWIQRVLLAASQDGLDWIVQPEILAERAAVPELLLDPEGQPVVRFVHAGSPLERLGAIRRDHDGAWRRAPTNPGGVYPSVVRPRDGGSRACVKADPEGTRAVYASGDGLNGSPPGEAIRASGLPGVERPVRVGDAGRMGDAAAARAAAAALHLH